MKKIERGCRINRWLVILFLICAMARAMAIESDIYSVNLPIMNQSAQERNEAFMAGLRQVLVKVSGNAQVLQRAQQLNLQQQAQDYVETYAYQPAATAEHGYQLQIRYQPLVVDKLLKTLGYMSWSERRPMLLAWLVVENATGQRSLMTEDNDGLLVKSFKETMKAHGLPMILPIMDLQNLELLNADSVWGEDWDRLHQVAKRYAVNSQVLIRMRRQLMPTWQGEAVLLHDHDRYDFTSSKDTEQAVIRDLVNQFSVHLSAPSNENEQHELKHTMLTVSGLKNLNEYAKLTRILKALPMLSDIDIKHFSGSQVEVELSYHGSRDELTQAIDNLRYLKRQLKQDKQKHDYYLWKDLGKSHEPSY